MYNNSLYHIYNRNILFNEIVTRMNKYIIMLYDIELKQTPKLMKSRNN